MSDSNREDKQKEADLEVALINLQTQRDLLQRTMEAKRQSLLREELKELKSLQQEGPAKVRMQQEEETLNVIRKYTGYTKDQIDERVEYEIGRLTELEEHKKEILDESFQHIANSFTSLADIFEINKQRELSAAGDNAEKREAIERKYSEKQKLLAEGQALINGAVAITEIWRKWGAVNAVFAGILTALVGAQTAAQVAVIRSQKFARGGSGILEGPVHASGGVNIGIGEAEGGEHISVTSRAMTSRYGSGMLDAVSNSINQGKFFEVWSNANKSMEGDPYTRKMYELMRKTPSVYTDSEGNTVKEYPNGEKYVIKNFRMFRN
jgi:hypothetical protein